MGNTMDRWWQGSREKDREREAAKMLKQQLTIIESMNFPIVNVVVFCGP